jgi:hypothetical protein
MYPAIWQEKILCINSAPEWVYKLNFKLRVMCALWLICLWRIREMLETLQFVYYEVVYLREETARLNFMQLAVFAMPKKQHFEKFSRVGLYDPPSGSLCLTFSEMAKSSHEQSARATILNSNRPEP